MIRTAGAEAQEKAGSSPKERARNDKSLIVCGPPVWGPSVSERRVCEQRVIAEGR